MKASELVMNIAVNLVRIARFAEDGRAPRVRQFTQETEEYLQKLEQSPRSERFEHTLVQFKKEFAKLVSAKKYDADYIDDLHTWANILTHRAERA